MKLSDNRKLFSSGIFDQRLGAITIFSSFLERYCAHQEKVLLDIIKCLQLYINRNFSHTGSLPDS